MLSRVLTIIVIFCTITFANADGISLNQSRIIYSENDKSQMVQVHNGTNQPILVQASILKEVDGNAVDAFIISPPLFRVDSESEFAMRVMPNNIGNLPKDRESIFYLKTRAIPATKKAEGEKEITSIVFVTAFVIKLIYRPSDINEPKKSDYAKVNVVKNGTQWQFDNPTPYYMTVVGLNIDGKTNSESFLIKPFDKYLINSSINNPSSVSWYFVNDYGVNTEKQTIKLELDDSQSDKKTML